MSTWRWDRSASLPARWTGRGGAAPAKPRTRPWMPWSPLRRGTPSWRRKQVSPFQTCNGDVQRDAIHVVERLEDAASYTNFGVPAAILASDREPWMAAEAAQVIDGDLDAALAGRTRDGIGEILVGLVELDGRAGAQG